MSVSTKRSRRRRQVWARDAANGLVPCCYCAAALNYQEMTIEHVVRLSDGGSWDLANLRPACGECNERKALRENAERWETMIEGVSQRARERRGNQAGGGS